MTIQEISELMSDLEEAALQSFQTTAEAFDLFNQGAAQCIRALLSENNDLRCEIAKLKEGKDAPLDSSLIGGTD